MVLPDLTLGEMVEWDESAFPSHLPFMIEKYGKGPFKVVGLNLRSVTKSGDYYSVTIETQGVEQSFDGRWFKRAS